ncbi:MAG: mitochondrial fission ELM1 family protein [Candidatus Omnitrophica bacterium]|nr:mitochondrial fission ELM1 family protein [Candidatus Omnitrophota bacterium]
MDILVLDDGIKGNLNQAMGIAEALAGKTEIFRVSLKGPSYRLPSRKGTHPLSGKLLSFLCCLRLWNPGEKLLMRLLKEQKTIAGRNFDIIISAGSVLAPVNLLLGKTSDKTASVQIMTPSMVPLKFFDFLVIPFHDYLKIKNKGLNNLIVTMGATNRINEDFLANEKMKLGEIMRLPSDKKKVGVVIGGDDQNYGISLNFIKKLLDALHKNEKECVFLYTTSRRTRMEVVFYLQNYLKESRSTAYSEFPGYSETSHYPGMLSLCDLIIVTEDSVNMISEAASCGKPVIILGVERKKRRKLIFDLTIEKFAEKGYAEYLPLCGLDTLNERIKTAGGRSSNKLREAEECARKILKTLK